ncbi:MAG: excinuclease ABC subunit C [Candidatus Wildermuthbacteria bacterium RIFCSPHIGHO2_02_FULL_47_12]|uniref:Excinuclease ABC subunit C n=1 Tax=Candidatus Wildermuthbacteria bacterium RIFCSPHIGHO2_02_FULL_47_12 TaxID=1802451 RepID=A0A1G2R2M7_9BACT|nr:MAG: excinuclease ABC subunit C [Candidatus Wildermuthbacteria bacterium RIFCSPHIGHO2_02_FULL_47_12]
MFYVYVLRSEKDNQLYIGYSEDLKRRFKEHNEGKNQSTVHRRPFILVYYEAYRSKDDAMKREKMLKLQGRTLGGLKRRLQSSLG